jgi:acetyl-CoA C-acetyltransferase
MSWIIAAKRTAVVPHNGAFAQLSIEDLGAPVVQALLDCVGLSGSDVDEIIVANALGAGGNPARRVALAAGLPDRVAGLSIDRQCAGGLDAILIARALVDSGAAQVVIAGGVESYSRRPLRARTDPAGGPPVPYSQAPFTPWPDRDPDMAAAAHVLGVKMAIDRDAQDDWAVRSHAKAIRGGASQVGEIVPLLGQDVDAFARMLTPKLAARAASLHGTITAANAAVAADGAAFVLVVSDELAAGRGLQIMGGVTLGGDPQLPGLAPVAAINAVLARAGIAIGDIATAEVMEAYAVQAIACVEGAGLPPDRVNQGGGALARGHPIGASGAVLTVRLFYQLQGGYGLAAIAAAGGLGTGLLVRRP